MTNIPVMLSLNPYTTQNGVVTTDQRVMRGGLILIGQAAAAAGGGPVYVADLSGLTVEFDLKTGQGTRVPVPAKYGPQNYIRYNQGSEVCTTQPTFNWLDPNDDNTPGYRYTCTPTGGQ